MTLEPIPMALLAALMAFFAGWSLAAWRGARRLAPLKEAKAELEKQLAERTSQLDDAQAAQDAQQQQQQQQ